MHLTILEIDFLLNNYKVYEMNPGIPKIGESTSRSVTDDFLIYMQYKINNFFKYIIREKIFIPEFKKFLEENVLIFIIYLA